METDAQVRGHTTFDIPATQGQRIFASTLDLWAGLLILLTGTSAWSVSPLPDAWIIFVFFLGWRLLTSLLEITWGFTLGKRILGIQAQTADEKKQDFLPRWFFRALPFFKNPPVLQMRTPAAKIPAISSLLFVIATFFIVQKLLLTSPIMQSAEKMSLTAYYPPGANLDRSPWLVMPIFYASGAWPKKFQGRSVLFDLPYSKGPPKRFAGKIIARWAMPHTYVTFRGPKTHSHLNVDALENCFSQPWNLRCAIKREKNLKNHLSEIRDDFPDQRPQDWKIQWFEVKNSATPREDWPRGIYLQAQTSTAIQDRFILINKKGTQQTIVLNRDRSPQGELAIKLLMKSIRSLRVFEQLAPGRALVDERLSDTRLKELYHLENSQAFVARMAEIQALLISKISVEPKSYQAYYHLGGTALMIARHAADLRVRKTQVLSSRFAGILEEWSTASKPLVHSAYLYAKDVRPKHPNTEQLEKLWAEAQKL